MVRHDQASPDDKNVQDDQRDYTDQAELLGKNSEHEVCTELGYEFKV